MPQTPTGTELAVDLANRHAIDLARVEAGSVAAVTALLNDLDAHITTKLLTSDLGPGKAEKLAVIQAAAEKAIGSTYGQIAANQQATLTQVAGMEAKQGGKMINAALGGIDVFGPVLTEKQWTAVAKDSAVFGAASGDWWAKQDESLRFKFKQQIQQGYALGETVDEMARRIRGTKKNGYTDGIMATSRREAQALVRSSVQTISNQARLAGYKENADIIKGIRWVATLDGRTTPTCRALDGLVWRIEDYEPIGHDKNFPGPTAHWNCRSTQVPVTRSWAELSGKPIKALKGKELQDAMEAKLAEQGMEPAKIATALADARASMDGQVPASTDFQKWLGTKPPSYVQGLLGPTRAKMWQDGKLTIRDLTDQDNRPLTIAQLDAAITAGAFPPETEGLDFTPAVQAPPYEPPTAAPTPFLADPNGTWPEPKATKAEALAIKHYTGQAFDINIALRDGTDYSDWTFSAPKIGTITGPKLVADLDSFFAKVPPTTHPMTVWRGVKSWDGMEAALQPGQTFTDKGYVSTSDSEEFGSAGATGVTFKIQIPKGSEGVAKLGKLAQAEAEGEVLFARDATFKVESYDPATKTAVLTYTGKAGTMPAAADPAQGQHTKATKTGTPEAEMDAPAPAPVVKLVADPKELKALQEAFLKQQGIDLSKLEGDDPVSGDQRVAEIWNALTDTHSNIAVLTTADGKIGAAISWGKEPEGGNKTKIKNIGSLTPGGGSQVLKAAVDDCVTKGSGIWFYALDPTSHPFYLKWGFKPTKHDPFWKKNDMVPFFMNADTTVETKAKLDAYLAGKAGTAPTAATPAALPTAPAPTFITAKEAKAHLKTLMADKAALNTDAGYIAKNALGSIADGSLSGAVMLGPDGKLQAVVAWHETTWDTVELDYLASLQPGHGAAMLKIPVDHAAKTGKGIEFESLSPDASEFYSKWGFKNVAEDGVIDQESPFFAATHAETKKIKGTIDAYLAAKQTETPADLHAEATTKIADVLANPKGQTLLAKALAKLQKSEPDLSPTDMLAKAEGMAAEQQAAASKASKLSTAKAKILAGKAPTASEQATIDALTPDEAANWQAAIADAKAATGAAKAAKLIAKSQAGEQFDQADMAELSTLGPEHQKLVKDAVAMEANKAGAKATLAYKEHAGHPIEQAAIADLKADGFNPDTDPIGFLSQVNAYVSSKANAALMDYAANPKGQTLKHKALADALGLKLSEMQPGTALAAKIVSKGTEMGGPTELLKLVDGVAAEKQAAASKASKLSTAKKKLVEGKAPAPAEQALIDSLTPEELANFNASVADAKAAATGSNPVTTKAVADMTGLPVPQTGGVTWTPQATVKWAGNATDPDAVTAKQQVQFNAKASKLPLIPPTKPLTEAQIDSAEWDDSGKHQMAKAAALKGGKLVIVKDAAGYPVGAANYNTSGDSVVVFAIGQNGESDATYVTLLKEVVAEAAKTTPPKAVVVAAHTDLSHYIGDFPLFKKAGDTYVLPASDVADTLADLTANHAIGVPDKTASKPPPEPLTSASKTTKIALGGKASKNAVNSIDLQIVSADPDGDDFHIEAAESGMELIKGANGELHLTKDAAGNVTGVISIHGGGGDAVMIEGMEVWGTATPNSDAKALLAIATKQAADKGEAVWATVKPDAQDFYAGLGFEFNTPKSATSDALMMMPYETAVKQAAAIGHNPQPKATSDATDTLLSRAEILGFNATSTNGKLTQVAKNKIANLNAQITNALIDPDGPTIKAGAASKAIGLITNADNHSASFTTHTEAWDTTGVINITLPDPEEGNITMINGVAAFHADTADADTKALISTAIPIAKKTGMPLFINADPDQYAMLESLGFKHSDPGDTADSSVMEMSPETVKAHADILEGKAVNIPEPKAPPQPKAAKPDPTLTAPDLGATNQSLYVPDPAGLTTIKTLPGSTRPVLAKDPVTGKQWVVKSPDQGGGGEPHLRSEATADTLYREMGAAVPGSAFVVTGGKPYKVAEFIEGAQTLGQWESTATPAQRREVYAKLREHFVADALLGNWDVAGQSNDNILVTATGEPIRVDNGGSLAFRAQGKAKTKDEWKPQVDELVTMRDKAKAAGRTADIFSGITQAEIDQQIVAIVSKRERLVTVCRATEGDKTADMLRKRIDWLEEQLPASLRKPQVTPPAAPIVHPKIATAATTRYGTPVLAGATAFEDQEVIVWREKAPDGKQLTKAQTFLTPKASAELMQHLAANGLDVTEAAISNNTAALTTVPGDTFWPKLLAAAKTIGAHSGDKAYNQATIATFNAAKQELATFKKKAGLTADQKAMVAHYEKVIADLDNAMATGGAPTEHWSAAAPIPKAATSGPALGPQKTITLNGVTVTMAPSDKLSQTRKELVGGELVDTNQQNHTEGAGRLIVVRSGPVEVKIIPYRASTDKTARSLQGMVRINIEGTHAETAILDGMRALQAVGVDVRPPSASQRELLYLHKTIHARGDAELTAYTKIINGPGTDDAKIEAVKKWAEARYGVTLPRDRSGWHRYYNPEGEAPATGVGHHTYRRWDESPAKLKAAETASRFYHSGNIEAATLGWLSNGGQVTTTIHRLRTGVPMVNGASWTSDIERGGGNYLYTNRIGANQDAGAGIYFKGDLITRVDIQSHKYDSYGEWEAQNGDRRRRTIEEIRQPTGTGICTNTGLFKNGMQMTDVDVIKTGSQAAANSLIAKVRALGIDKWPDGRKLTDVIKP